MSDFSDVSFDRFDLDPRLLAAMSAEGFTQATRIQAASLPPLLEGRDLVARARTGSGKTAAFGIPLLERCKEGGTPPKALVFAPTRELARQIARTLESLSEGLPVEICTIYGGIPYPPQLEALQTASVVVGTPGRMRDHVARGTLDLSEVRTVVLDEADRMLQMGLIEDIVAILEQTPASRQVVMCSATMPPEMAQVADAFLNDPMEVQVETEELSVDHIEQSWTLVPKRHTVEALKLMLAAFEPTATLMFTNTRVAAAEMADALVAEGIRAAGLHGDMSQRVRESVLQQVRDGEVDVLVATDVAARGLDVDHISHVINLELPTTTETYVHRIGRTGRLGRQGVAMTLATSKGKRALHELSAALDHPIQPVDLPVPEGVSPPEWARPAAQFGKPPPVKDENVNEVRLFCSVGSRHGIRASDLVGCLTKEVGLRGRDVGKVEVFERFSFVGLSKDTLAIVLAEAPTVVIREREVTFSEAAADPGGPNRSNKRRRR